MYYEIKNVSIYIEDEQLFIGGEYVESNHKTIKCIFFILKTDNLVFTKDELLSMVWDDTVVTDSSIFKQIQTVRKLFANHGLPKDTIESVYGKGYKVKYPIKQLDDKPEKICKKNKPIKPIIILCVSLVIIVATFLILNPKQHNEFNRLTKEKKVLLEKEIKQDWALGLKQINSLLTNNASHYSEADISFLMLKKGEAELHLQQPAEAVKSIQESLNGLDTKSSYYITALLKLSRAQSSNLQTSEALDTINKALAFMENAEPSNRLVDALMTKALLLRKINDFNQSIKYNLESLKQAKNLNDVVGELIAVNNLATTYQMMGNYKAATEYSEIGLKLSLDNGNPQYIANSYVSMTSNYIENGDYEKAKQMIEKAINYQVSNNNLRYLKSKLYFYYYLAIISVENEKAEEIKSVFQSYLSLSNPTNDTKSKFQYLNALHFFTKGEFVNASKAVEDSKSLINETNLVVLKVKLMTLDAILSYLNNNDLRVIESGKAVLSISAASDKDKFLISSVLSLSYLRLENPDNYKTYNESKNQLFNSKWIFENFISDCLETHTDSNRNSQAFRECFKKRAKEPAINKIDLNEDLIISLSESIKKLNN